MHTDLSAEIKDVGGSAFSTQAGCSYAISWRASSFLSDMLYLWVEAAIR
jgi:hypothetical protein